MKKIKLFLLVMVLSITLTTNSFGSNSIVNLTTSVFDSIRDAVVSLFTNDNGDDCPLRVCGDCRPGNPSCRPSQN